MGLTNFTLFLRLPFNARTAREENVDLGKLKFIVHILAKF